MGQLPHCRTQLQASKQLQSPACGPVLDAGQLWHPQPHVQRERAATDAACSFNSKFLRKTDRPLCTEPCGMPKDRHIPRWPECLPQPLNMAAAKLHHETCSSPPLSVFYYPERHNTLAFVLRHTRTSHTGAAGQHTADTEYVCVQPPCSPLATYTPLLIRYAVRWLACVVALAAAGSSSSEAATNATIKLLHGPKHPCQKLTTSCAQESCRHPRSPDTVPLPANQCSHTQGARGPGATPGFFKQV